MRTGKPKRHDTKWFVRIGEEFALRFTRRRAADDPLRLLGSVTRGAQIGALATNDDGDYVQINGDHVTPLSRSQVHRAVTKARTTLHPSPPRRPHTPCSSMSPVITVKRRRTSPMGTSYESR